jgi:hypothetical protein
VAEGLVERIGAEIDKRIDKRIDTRLGQREPAPAPARAPVTSPAPRMNAVAVTLALGSMGMGVLASLAVLKNGGPGNSPGETILVVVIWLVIGIINVVYARRN